MRRLFLNNIQLFASCCAFLFLICAVPSIVAENDEAEGEGKTGTNGQEETEKKNTILSSDDADSEGAQTLGPSPDVQTSCLFTSLRSGPASRELVAGQIVRLLIGIANRGEKDIVVKSCETSFRYPLDFSYHTQNFSAVRYERLVQPKQEATFDYAFVPSDAFIGRPLGLVVDLHYVDSDGQYFVSAVFNETVTIAEDESGFNTETYFMYLVLAGFVVVLVLIAQHYLSKFTRGGSGGGGKSAHQSQKNGAVGNSSNYEMGSNKNDVDYEWIPRNNFATQKIGSPRNRKQQEKQQPSSSI